MSMADQSKRPDWRGHTAVVVASGPSLTATQLATVSTSHGTHTIAVNSSALVFPWWEICYSGDFLWWKSVAMRHPAPAAMHAPRTALWTCDRASAERWPLSWVKGTNRPGLAHDCVNMNGNSGAQAINLAYLFGARRIVLLGFDMKLGPKGERHHHPDHPAPCVQEQLFAEWIHKLEPVAKDLKAAGCEVINCTPGSALPWFPMATLEETLR